MNRHAFIFRNSIRHKLANLIKSSIRNVFPLYFSVEWNQKTPIATNFRGFALLDNKNLNCWIPSAVFPTKKARDS